MLQIRKDLCLGCGLCAQNCPQGAIYLFCGQAEIDKTKCNCCALCQEVCPQRAITEVIPVSFQTLRENIQDMTRQTESILVRIDRLIQTDTVSKS